MLARGETNKNLVIRHDLMAREFPSIWVEIETDSGRVIVGALYREWHDRHGDGSRDGQRKRLEIFLDQVNRASAEKKKLLLLGDYNLDLIRLADESDNYSERWLAAELLSWMEAHGIDPVDIGPTFTMNIGSGEIIKTINTSIDHVYLGGGLVIRGAKTVPHGMSDHDPVLVELNKKKRK